MAGPLSCAYLIPVGANSPNTSGPLTDDARQPEDAGAEGAQGPRRARGFGGPACGGKCHLRGHARRRQALVSAPSACRLSRCRSC